MITDGKPLVMEAYLCNCSAKDSFGNGVCHVSYSLLLNGDVGEVDEHVVHLMCATIILGATEATEATLEEIRADGSERCH